MSTPIHVFGIAGSLRSRSYNAGLLRAAGELLPVGMRLETCDLSPIPMYNQDYDTAMPEVVLDFKRRIEAADALLIVTPEYNHSIPGVLKNALDWASRPFGKSSLSGKPLAIMGAASGQFGTARAQTHLRQIAVSNNMLPLSKPDVLVAQAAAKFDDAGHLTDPATREAVQRQLEAFAAWVRRLRGE